MASPFPQTDSTAPSRCLAASASISPPRPSAVVRGTGQDQLISLVFIAVSAILTTPTRTRPLIVPVTALWLIAVTIHFISDQPKTDSGLPIVAIGVTAGTIRDGKKLIVQIKG
ncbi:hypothetical protein ACE1SV_56740 [Streptomyces sp. E-15]